MPKLRRKGSAVWEGDLKSGRGTVSTETGVVDESRYTFSTRFENEPGTNPEELIAAAHAACFSMALAGDLAGAGYEPERIQTTATCTVSSVDGGFRITHMLLETRAEVPDIDKGEFMELARGAKEGCPVSKALAGIDEIELDATLE